MKVHFLKIIAISQLLAQMSLAAYIQVGDDYTKESYKDVYQSTHNQHIQSLIDNTVLINSPTKKGVSRGTGFYIGQHKGEHLFLTNAHVMTKKDCDNGASITFLKSNFKRSKATCHSVLIELNEDSNSDVTLFTLSENDMKDFRGQGLDIDINFKPKSGTLLASNGFGLKNSRTRSRLTRFSANTTFDNDCAIASKDDSLLHISNVGAKYVFATGCDMASGDSGSAMIDRESGKVLGIIFLVGKNAKRKNKISSKDFWDKHVGTNSNEVWSHMSYAISLAELAKGQLAPFLDYNSSL